MSFTSKVIVGLVLALTSLGVGYQLGTLTSSNSAATPSGHAKEPVPQPKEEAENAENANEDEDEDEELGDIADGDLASISAGFLEPCKLVLVVRTDLKMTSGKIAAQCGHATLACYKALMKKNSKLVQHWERIGQAKIALKANSEDQLLELEAIAKSLNLCARTIQDQGRTQVEEGTRTVLGIGPAPVGLINQVTGDLRLL